jgi:4-amino-4-deoxy-L-arabinose transferase-like glycosyltransferase
MKAFGLSILSALLKIILLALDVIPFNSDEAIVALMARHTLAGDWPTFFYGQAYMGSLDTTLVAAGFLLVGQKVVVIRIVQIILYSLTVVTTAQLGRMIFGSERIGLLAALFLVIPTVNTTLYTTISLGGYGEALLIGNLLMIAALKSRIEISIRWVLAWGFLSGLGLWAFGITMVFILPSAILLAYGIINKTFSRRSWAAVVAALGAGIIGAAPILIYAIENGTGTLMSEFLGSAISGASATNIFLSIYDHLINLFLFGTTATFGLRPPWEIRWLGVPLIPLAMGFWLIVIGLTIRNMRNRDNASEGRWLLGGVAVTLMTAFILTPFGADPSGRYFLPLLVPMAIFAGEVVGRFAERGVSNEWAYLLVASILLFNLWGTIQSATRNPPGLTTQFDSVTRIDHSYDRELIQFLEQNGETRGYTNYWVSYPVAFLSEERIIFVPKLPYHEDFRYTARDNRYEPYNIDVSGSDQAAYITTNHPDLDERLIANFVSMGITWEEVLIGDYHVFYNLSAKVTPENLAIEDWENENLDLQTQ